MASKLKRPVVGWGELNIALNALVKQGIIMSYSTAAVKSATSIEVTTATGADQAEVVRQVRGALPSAFSEARVRTRTA